MSLKRRRRPSLSDLYAQGTRRKLVKQQVHLYKREAKRTFSRTCSLPLVYEEDKVLICGWLLTIFPLELLRIVFEYSVKAPEDIHFGIRMGPQLPVFRIGSLYHHFRLCEPLCISFFTIIGKSTWYCMDAIFLSFNYQNTFFNIRKRYVVPMAWLST